MDVCGQVTISRWSLRLSHLHPFYFTAHFLVLMRYVRRVQTVLDNLENLLPFFSKESLLDLCQGMSLVSLDVSASDRLPLPGK